jgi:hypothetical protein
MVIVVAIHQVPDYGRWKRAFDLAMGFEGHDGLIGYRLFQAADDASEILVALDFDTVPHAEAWLAKADQNWLDKAGMTMYPPTVVGEPIDEGHHSGGRR